MGWHGPSILSQGQELDQQSMRFCPGCYVVDLFLAVPQDRRPLNRLASPPKPCLHSVPHHSIQRNSESWFKEQEGWLGAPATSRTIFPLGVKPPRKFPGFEDVVTEKAKGLSKGLRGLENRTRTTMCLKKSARRKHAWASSLPVTAHVDCKGNGNRMLLILFTLCYSCP